MLTAGSFRWKESVGKPLRSEENDQNPIYVFFGLRVKVALMIIWQWNANRELRFSFTAVHCIMEKNQWDMNHKARIRDIDYLDLIVELP